MSIDDIRIFLIVASEKSFVNSARALFMSQSAVSQRIKKIESELGFALFDRDRHSVSLTAKGEILFNSCRELLAGYDAALAQCRKLDSEKHFIKISYLGNSNANILPDIYSSFSRQYPNCEIIADRITPAELRSGFASSKIRLALAPEHFIGDIPNIHFLPVMEDSHVCVMNRSNPIAQKEKISYRDIENCTLLYPSARPLPFHIAQVYNTINEKNIPCSINYGYEGKGFNIDNIVQYIASAQTTIAIMPWYISPVHPMLCALPFDSGIKMNVGFAYNSKLTAEEKAFLAVVKRVGLPDNIK